MEYCPECGLSAKMKLVEYNDLVIIKGKLVVYTANSLQCKICFEMYDTKKTLGENLRAAREAFKCMI